MNLKTILYISVLSVLVLLVFVAAGSSNLESKGDDTYQVEITHDVLPQKLDFAGEKVPLEYFDVKESLEREVISNMYFHSQSIYLLKRVERYFSVIEPILARNNVPDDFKYLAVAESVLFDNVKSPVGAVGIWQLMKGTAEDYGLEVNDNVDERCNLELSTQAACQFLLESFAKYNDWTLVAASYNMGRRALDRTLEYQKQESYYDMNLNTETGRYVYRILAFKLLLSSPEHLGYKVSKKERYETIECDTVFVNYPIEHLGDFAAEHHMTYRTLKLFNPWLMENKLNNQSAKKYKVLVPPKGYRTK